jgi:hypothetical protein
MTECPQCHAPLPDPPDRFCPNCGADLGAIGGGAPPPPSGYPPPPPIPPPPYGGPPPLEAPGQGSWRGSAAGGGPPWERRDQLGLLAALIETTKQVLSGPADFFRRMPVTGGIGAPLVYALILGYLGLVASTIYNTVFQSVLGSSMAGMGGAGRWERIAPLLEGGAGLVVNLVFGPVFILIGLFLSSGIFHLMLLALAGGGRGFEATFRTAAYSQAAAVFNIIPLCGGVVGAVYTIVLLVIGLSEAHGISRGKAAAAVLLPLVILCCCCAGAAGLVLGGLAGALGRAG